MALRYYWHVLRIYITSTMSELAFLVCAGPRIEIWRRESSKCGQIPLQNESKAGWLQVWDPEVTPNFDIFPIFAAARTDFMRCRHVLSVGMSNNMSELTFLVCAGPRVEIWRRGSSKRGRIHLKNAPISTLSLVNLQRGFEFQHFSNLRDRPHGFHALQACFIDWNA